MVFLAQAVLLIGLFTLFVTRLLKDPIRGILSFPPVIRQRVAGLPQYTSSFTARKKAHLAKKLLILPLLLVYLAAGAWLSGLRTFLPAFGYGMALFFIANLWDLLVLDWLWFCRSPSVRIPGTEDMDKAYRDPWHHLRGFFMGMAFSVPLSLMAALLLVLQSVC